MLGSAELTTWAGPYIEFVTLQQEEAINDVLRLVSSHGIRLKSINVENSTLEEVFMQIAGGEKPCTSSTSFSKGVLSA